MNSKNILARNLRKNQTPQEQKLWRFIRNNQLGVKFKRQYPIGDYIVDFICREKWLIIELDGSQHNEDNNIINDEIRTKYLESRGFKVIRFWNNDINNNIEDVILEIKKYID